MAPGGVLAGLHGQQDPHRPRRRCGPLPGDGATLFDPGEVAVDGYILGSEAMTVLPVCVSLGHGEIVGEGT